MGLCSSIRGFEVIDITEEMVSSLPKLIELVKEDIKHHDWRSLVQEGYMGTCQKTVEPLRELLNSLGIDTTNKYSK